ncbi:MAG: immunity 26/phosphotriesterase HocA family protein, partial [Pseudomonadota bacterium]
MKRDKPWRKGDLLALPLHGFGFGFARVLDAPLFEFFDFTSLKLEHSANEISIKPVLFKIWVSKYARLEGNWRKFGHSQLGLAEYVDPKFFRKDAISGKIYEYNHATDNSKPLSLEQAKRLECAAVWDPQHVEERLTAYFQGTQSIWLR